MQGENHKEKTTIKTDFSYMNIKFTSQMKKTDTKFVSSKFLHKTSLTISKIRTRTKKNTSYMTTLTATDWWISPCRFSLVQVQAGRQLQAGWNCTWPSLKGFVHSHTLLRSPLSTRRRHEGRRSDEITTASSFVGLGTVGSPVVIVADIEVQLLP